MEKSKKLQIHNTIKKIINLKIKNMENHFLLDEKGNPYPVADLLTWAKGFETMNRVVKQDTIDNVFVSTVFLGLNHSFGTGKPLLFETMIFNGEHDQYCERYSTKRQALNGHKRALQLVTKKEATLWNQ